MSAPAQWRDLRRFTPARVALGRVGNGLPTTAHLDFQAAHAAARDAVHARLDIPVLLAELEAVGLAAAVVRSACADRAASPICSKPMRPFPNSPRPISGG